MLPVALPPGPVGVSGQSGGHGLVPVATTGDDGPLKKTKKERKERGRENGREDCECICRTLMEVSEFLFNITCV